MGDCHERVHPTPKAASGEVVTGPPMVDCPDNTHRKAAARGRDGYIDGGESPVERLKREVPAAGFESCLAKDDRGPSPKSQTYNLGTLSSAFVAKT